MNRALTIARTTTAEGKLATSTVVESARTFSEGMACLGVLRPKALTAEDATNNLTTQRLQDVSPPVTPMLVTVDVI